MTRPSWLALLGMAHSFIELDKAVLSKSLIQFSFDGWSCVPSLLFTWGQTMLVKKTLYHLSHQGSQTMVEAMKILGTSFKRSHACTATLSAPNPAAGHHRPWLHWRLLDVPRQVWVCLWWGSVLLTLGSWCTQGSVCALQESISQPCVSSGSFMVGLMATSSKRRNLGGSLPYPSLLHPEPLPLWQCTADLYFHRRHSDIVLSQSLWGLWVLVRTGFV